MTPHRLPLRDGSGFIRFPKMSPSELITIATGVVSIVGGVAVAIRGLLHLQRHFDERFDRMEKGFDSRLDALGGTMHEFVRRYEVEQERNFRRDEMLDYKIGQLDQKLNHKTLRFENAINQLSAFLEKNHNYRPRQIFPVTPDE